MNPEKITEYMADLPAATQHYDLLTLWGLPVERVLGWGDYVSTWEEVSSLYSHRL